MQERRWTIIAFLSVMLPIGFAVLMEKRHASEQPILAPTNAVAEAQGSKKISSLRPSDDEMQWFAKNVLQPAMTKAEKAYPSARLRKQFADLLKHMVDNGIKIRFLPQFSPWFALSLGSETPIGVQFMIGYSIPQAMRVFATSGEQAMHHHLVAYTLHEGYHLEHHPDRDWPPLRQRESEAWAHDCTNTIRILREDELFEELPAQSFFRFVARAYDETGGNLDHPAWQSVIDVATGAKLLSTLPPLQ